MFFCLFGLVWYFSVMLIFEREGRVGEGERQKTQSGFRADDREPDTTGSFNGMLCPTPASIYILTHTHTHTHIYVHICGFPPLAATLIEKQRPDLSQAEFIIILCSTSLLRIPEVLTNPKLSELFPGNYG